MNRKLASLVLLVGGLAGCSGEVEAPIAGTTASANPLSKGDQPPPPPTSSIRVRKPFEVDLPGTQRAWDPGGADELPLAPAGTVPGLPVKIAPPVSAVDLQEAPIPAAVMAVRRGPEVLLLSTDGEWRSLPLAGRYPSVGLSPGGTRAHTVAGSRVRAPIVVYDLTTGERHEVRYPSRFEDWEYRTWVWIDERTLFLDDFSHGWVVDAATGDATRVDYPGLSLSWSFDPSGALVAGADWGQPRTLTDWATGRPRTISMRTTGRLSDIQASEDAIVGSSYDGHPFAVVVADRRFLEPQYVLPVRDRHGAYGNGGLGVVALREDGTVLLRVNALGRRDGFRIVLWDPVLRTVETVTAMDVSVLVVFADGLLRRTDP
jgi:hypothetical protein